MIENFLSHSSEHSLDEWLSYLESLHSSEIDLGLTRVGEVAERLSIDFSFAKVITVAGTNGKGTTCAFIEQVLLSKGKSVAVYSSPHIEHFNERLRINQDDVADQPIIDAFKQIEQARAEISLTYYEYTTLAAFLILMSERPEFIVLEVGLGGRLDATNIINADIAVVTTVDLDHQAFLGNDRETIGREKAGILRTKQHAILGEVFPPESVLKYANDINANVWQREKSFCVSFSDDKTWFWQSSSHNFNNLPLPYIPLDNVATAIMVITLLVPEITEMDLIKAINKTRVAGRTEHFKASCDVVLDVGHNPLAARYLSQYVKQYVQNKPEAKVYAVAAMLADKDIKSTLIELHKDIDAWYVASLTVSRGARAQVLAEYLSVAEGSVNCFDKVEDAYKMALSKAQSTDLILVFGSFYTVASIRKLLV
ncbi:bifunctional tetrahydrofolate synthase/dihydrofolate synthase [Thalassotalea profundi]|uniref:Dihydrofolate synthase/folylpolyglutamate synthase n=1 Tax=Thalassotalea profundi TaxID=2036687 RepID=A0ABQ3IFR5_9GAMM|nr:bifunctional tetrahydrofolate synthase/dihydrofolate synthase [Thalassotalea profundi]GHE77106.1 bifunctional folylpolyglutamate synthase/dihydrofolate synthase [Thalassotalea profundi]